MKSLVAHRINTIHELQELDPDVGVECDLRDHQGEIVLHHDPFIEQAENFRHFCQSFRHGLLILNIKSEGIESKILEILEEFSISHFVFLDSSFPMIVKHSKQGINNFALRYSEFEGLGAFQKMMGSIHYAWVDNFIDIDHMPEAIVQLQAWGYKTILVSPELQGRAEDIEVLKKKLNSQKIKPDFICTKKDNFKLWQS